MPTWKTAIRWYRQTDRNLKIIQIPHRKPFKQALEKVYFWPKKMPWTSQLRQYQCVELIGEEVHSVSLTIHTHTSTIIQTQKSPKSQTASLQVSVKSLKLPINKRSYSGLSWPEISELSSLCAGMATPKAAGKVPLMDVGKMRFCACHVDFH